MKRITAEKLYKRRSTGDALAVGQDIFSSLSPTQQVARAGAVLEACAAWVHGPKPVAQVIELAKNPSRWREGHDAHSAVRDLTLAEERASTSKAYEALLFVAENVAKTIFNASGQSAPFDKDAPWWISSCARTLVVEVGERSCEEDVWEALIGVAHRDFPD
jgi:hypothetical protein